MRFVGWPRQGIEHNGLKHDGRELKTNPRDLVNEPFFRRFVGNRRYIP
jgi:hypothetical protein